MKIRDRINLNFLVVFLIIFLIIGVSVYIYSSQLIKEQIYSYLYSSAKARAENIRTFLQDQTAMAKIMAASTVYRDLLKEPATSDQYALLRERVEKRLQRTLGAEKNLSKLFILDQKGKIIASTDLAEEGKDKSTDPYFLEGQENVYIKDIHFSEGTNKAVFVIAAPIKDDVSGETIGISVARYDADKFYSIVGGENGLGESEENFLINRDKYFLTPSRFLGESVILTKKVETKNAAECFDENEINQVKKSGYPGLKNHPDHSPFVEAKDYRNIDIIGTHFYIPETNWCLITKVDASEIFTINNKILSVFVIIFVISIIILILASHYVARRITKPLNKLQAGIKNIENGNLGYKVAMSSSDEIGDLSRAFDKMNFAVQESRREIEIKVQNQTQEISKKQKDLENQQKAVLNILEDVEEEKINASKLAVIVRDADEPIIGKDLNGIITSWNLGAQKLYGYTSQEVIGKSIKIILPPDRQNEFNNILKKIVKGENVGHLQTTRLKKDGSSVDVSVSISPITDASGKIIGASSIALDITKEKEIDKVKTEFVSLASHQLRTPLSAINWYTEMLLAGDAGKLLPEQKQYLDQVYASNKRMVDLVNALLNVSRLELGTFMIEPELADVTELADSIIKELIPSIEQKKLKLVKDFAKGLPKLSVDKKLLTIVFQNLLSNAVKYTPEKGQLGFVISKDKNNFTFKVADTGYGIPKAQQDKIFTKLFRADNVREKETEGTGLGLYIVKMIIDHSGGKIWFESQEGKGTTFYVTLPLSGMQKKEGTKSLG
ncbi:MAG: ATP-binding protein [Patescibacteria group bacterium]|jgi:PAS domain S-box-containing protein